MRRVKAEPRHYLAVAGASVVFLALLVAVSNAAAFAVKYVPDITNVNPGPSGAGETLFRSDCPASNPKVIGGGVEVDGDNSHRALSVGNTRPDLAGNGWIGGALNESGSAATMAVTAICADSINVMKVEHTRAVPPHTNRSSSTPPCPSSTKLIAGGIENSDAQFDDVINVASTMPLDGPDRNSTPDRWFGTANNLTNVSQSMTVYAICAPKAGRYKYVHSDPQALPDNSERSARAMCPAGTNVTGGGVDNSGSTRLDEVGAQISNTFPFDTDNDADSHPDDGWQGSAQNVNTGRAETVQVFAICQVPATHFFSGKFTEFDPRVGPATMSFALTHNGTRIHDWTWHHMPIHCREADDVFSSHYGANVRVDVVHHHFHAEGIKDPAEGFKTTLDGQLTHNNTKAHGTFSMTGPENGPPPRHGCRGTGHWSAVVQ